MCINLSCLLLILDNDLSVLFMIEDWFSLFRIRSFNLSDVLLFKGLLLSILIVSL